MRLKIVHAHETNLFMRAAMVLSAMLIVPTALFILINIKVRPFITSVTNAYAQNIVSQTLNSIVREELEKNEYDFVEITYAPNGEVVAVCSNAIDTNLLRARLIEKLKEKIAVLSERKLSIPIGNFLPHSFMSGLGPRIPVRFLLLSNTKIDVRESFKTSGINQTLYSIFFDVRTKLGVYIPTMSSSCDIECNIPVSQTLIVGKVPENYTSVSGAKGTPEDIVLNMVG